MDTKRSEKSTKAPLLAIIPFFFALIFFAAWSFFDADNEYSEAEARYLAQRPNINFEHLDWTISGLEDYAVDQFPARSKFLKAYSWLELLQRKTFTRDVFVEDGWIFSRTYAMTGGGLEAFENDRREFVTATESVAARGIPTVFAMLPVKNYLVEIEPSLHVDDASEANRQKYLSTFDGSPVLVSDIAGAMAEQDEATRLSQWYATDFHWNGDGAYAAAEQLLSDMADAGIMPPVDLSDLVERSEWDAEYHGDLSRRFSYLIPETQPVVVYAPKDVSSMRYYKSIDASNPVERSEIVAAGEGDPVVDYGGAYTKNFACYRVENANAAVDMRVVVFKDSLENAMTDILSAVFSELVVVDARFEQPSDIDETLADADAAVFIFHQNNNAPDTSKFVLGK